MPQRKKHTAGDMPAAQQRDERGGLGAVSHDLLGSPRPDRGAEPKLPHERDESVPDAGTANPAAAPDAEVRRRAHDDAASGRPDTDRGPVADATYHELRKKKPGK